MNVKIFKSKAEGKVTAPPSKSVAHRNLICAALSENSKVSNLKYSKDIEATLSCLEKLGTRVNKNGSEVNIGGLNPFDITEGTEIFCNESGSTLRFLIPLCLICGKKITLKGSSRLFERPLSVYEDIFKRDNIEHTKNSDSITICGKLYGGEYKVSGEISSQFISGLLFALPLIKRDSSLEILGNFESEPYVDLTIKALKDFGIEITRQKNTFYITGNQRYRNCEAYVEGDLSNAAFLEAFNLIGGRVEVLGIEKNTLQGDRAFIEMFRDLKNGKREFDLSNCPDLAPIMFAMASFFGTVRFTGTKRLKIKESDRAEAMAEELSKFSVKTEIYENSAIINGGNMKAPDRILCGHNDHRIVMAISVLLSLFGGEIEGAEAVSKSFPNFFEVLRDLKIGIDTSDN